MIRMKAADKLHEMEEVTNKNLPSHLNKIFSSVEYSIDDDEEEQEDIQTTVTAAEIDEVCHSSIHYELICEIDYFIGRRCQGRRRRRRGKISETECNCIENEKVNQSIQFQRTCFSNIQPSMPSNPTNLQMTAFWSILSR